AGLFFRNGRSILKKSREKLFLTYHIVKQNGVFAYILSNGFVDLFIGNPEKTYLCGSVAA
ncbi:hypothetical protein LJB97_00660, partial [Parabacteroides sp. OttesenSCG-928-O15]|nr:hypothetical protein [Parabacteroides sp. OttesenSCG-928-O15]